MLDQWRAIHEAEFGCDHDIPSSEEMNITKLNEAVVSSDACNAARLTSDLIAEAIEEAVREQADIEGVDVSALTIRVDCHHHLRNVWIKALNKHLSKYLNALMAGDLNVIDYRYCVSTKFDVVLWAIDKEFSLPANYPKGHGVLFKIWMDFNHPGALLLPVEHASGSRQDLTVEGAASVYWNRR